MFGVPGGVLRFKQVVLLGIRDRHPQPISLRLPSFLVFCMAPGKEDDAKPEFDSEVRTIFQSNAL